MAELWTVSEMTALFRALTGRKSTNQISDADILVKLNQYYRFEMPIDVGMQLPELDGWLTFTIGTGEDEDKYQLYYSAGLTVTFILSSVLTAYGVASVGPPVYVDDEPIEFWTDVTRFYDKYPFDYDETGQPTDVLLYGRELIFRPFPDDTYSVRIKRHAIPAELVSKPVHPLLGPVTAYGAAIAFLNSKGENDGAEDLAPAFERCKDRVLYYNIQQRPAGRRPPGGKF
jgi:hypothetical protein